MQDIAHYFLLGFVEHFWNHLLINDKLLQVLAFPGNKIVSSSFLQIQLIMDLVYKGVKISEPLGTFLIELKRYIC